MKHIKLKVKHLILIVFLGALLFNYRYVQILGYQLVSQVNQDLGNQLFEEMKVSNVYSANAKIENVLSNINTSIYNPVFFEEGSAMISGERIRIQDAEEILAQYEDFKNKESHGRLFNDYTINVSLTQWFAGSSEEAITVIYELDYDSLSNAEKEKVNMIKANYYLSMGKLDQAIICLEEVNDYYPNLKTRGLDFINRLKTNTIMAPNVDEGSITKSYTKEEKALRSLVDSINSDDYYDSMVYTDDTVTDNQSELSSEKVITGYVTIKGQPIQGAMVYLDESPNVSGSICFSDYITITDKNGYYELPAYEKRDSYVGLVIPWQLVNDKQIDFSIGYEPLEFDIENKAIKNFEFNEGAYFKTLTIKDNQLTYEIVDSMFDESRSYSMKISYVNPEYSNNNGSGKFTITSDELKGVIDLDEIRLQMGIPYAIYGGMDDFLLPNFLEPLYLSAEYYFEVTIYTQNNKGIISNGFFSYNLASTVYVEGEELSEGDLLIEQGDMVGAKNWYEENLSIHSMKILVALYDKGYIESEDKLAYYHGGRDREKAIYYAEKLYALDGANSYFISKLQYLYECNGDIDKAMELLEIQLEKEPENN